MPVQEARDRMRVAPNQVYVIPPNADLAIEQGVLRVLPPPPRRGSRTAIDMFLRSLAADQQERAIGVILSGTGSHGAIGIKEIKHGGGMVIAQTPESAEHDQMPRNAIATGAVDHVLPPDQIPPAIARYARHLASPGADIAPEDLEQVLSVLKTQLKRDFRGYRRNMLLRRVKRRMGLRRLDNVAAYVENLRDHRDEAQALAKDLSISVTEFFREPEAFDVLERVVVPELLQRAGRAGDAERPVRVWVPGCATGEEAYSIAMLFLEQFAAAARPVGLQIFATDIDEESLDLARTGIYPDTLAANVTAARLRQFFVRADAHHYQVSKPLRDVITFAPQNLLADAPFSRLDLIACRNVLIYLEPDVQAKILTLFHFALLDGGYLLLGPAEAVGLADRFEPVSKKWRVFRRIDNGRRDVMDIPILLPEPLRPRSAPRDDPPRSPQSAADVLHRALVADFAPAAVLVNGRYDILSVQGPVADYLEFPTGAWTRDLLSMARSGLRTAIRAVCERARREHRTAVDAGARVKRRSAYVTCTVTARPAGVGRNGEASLIVTFQDRPARRPKDAPARQKPSKRAAAARGDETLVRQLEHELAATRDDLQGTIHELETANQELKASHEEVMSMNEELQSTNEEMETSKEELQSLNEELSTVNSQLQDKVHELDASNNDMVNVLASTEIATVFLDAALRIKRFTPPTVRLLNLLPTDLGRPFRDIALAVADAALLDDCRRVLDQLAPVEAVIRTDDGRAYLRRVLPYRTADQHIEGVVIAWIDITQRQAAEAEARHLSAVLRDSNDAVAQLDLDGKITGWNRGAERLYGYSESEARGLQMRDLIPEAQRAAASDVMHRVVRGDAASESFDTWRITKDGRTRMVWATITLLRDAGGRAESLVTTERDVTELKEGLAAIQAAELYQRVIESLPAGAVLRTNGHLTMNRAAEAITGYGRSELATVDAWCAALHGSEASSRRRLYETIRPIEGPASPVPLAIVRKDGEARHIEFSVTRLDDRRDLWMLIDMTERDQAEFALHRSEDYLRSIVNTAADAIITIDDAGAIGTFNPAAERMFGYAAAEVVGRNIRTLMPPPYRDEHGDHLARYRTTGEAHIIGVGREVIGLRKDGSTMPLDLTVSQIDHPRRFTLILRDLTERRQLEWRLAESQAEERRHMARELHDEIGGHMTGIGLLAQSLESGLTQAGSPLAAKTQELVHNIAEAHQRLRSVVRGLVPVEAIPEGLMAAMDNLARHCETVSGIPCRFQCEPAVHVDDPVTALHLFRIAQEAVNNAVRHGQPSEITIRLEQTAQRLEVVVTDDGRGIGESAVGHAGAGLAGMGQRARLLGGDCSIQPRDGGGTIVRCWVPLTQRTSAVRLPRPTGRG
jgi:PAS domain S-box-containing protein